MDNFNLDINSIVSIVTALATFIAVVFSYRSIKKQNIDAILKEAKERTEFEVTTRLKINENTENINNNTNDIKSNTNDIRSNINDTRINTNEIKNNTKEIQVLKDDLKEIKSILDRLLTNKDFWLMTQKNSPRKLSKIGEQIYNDIVGDSFFNEYKDMFVSMLEEKAPQTALDVENFAVEVLLSKINDPMFNNIKNKVYNYPSIKTDNGDLYDVNMRSVCVAIAIPLRDEYLDKHPELK